MFLKREWQQSCVQGVLRSCLDAGGYPITSIQLSSFEELYVVVEHHNCKHCEQIMGAYEWLLSAELALTDCLPK